VRVLGIDPGLGRTGVAVVEGRPGSLRLLYLGCLETVPQSSDPARLHALQLLIAAAVRDWAPSVAAVERLFFSTNRTTAMRVSEARGVILAGLAGAGVRVAEYTPNEVKEAIAGYGAARKPQVMRMCARLLGDEAVAKGDDAADAVAIAVCHHHRASLGARGVAAPGRTAISPKLEAAVTAARAKLVGARR
jgi:crossover junction endodeoxyribonuclease RuvC